MAKAGQATKQGSNNRSSSSAKTGNSKDNRPKSAASGKNSTKKAKTNTKAPVQVEDAEEEISLSGEITVWVIGAVMLILELANFGLCGGVTKICDFFFGIFGAIQYVIPAAIMFSAFFLYVNEFHPRAVHKVVFGFIVLLGFGMFAQMFDGIPDKYDFKQLFLNGFSEHSGGGILCGSIAFILNKAIGKVGTYIIIVLAIIICVVLFAEISLIDVITGITGDVMSRDDEDYISDFDDEYEEVDKKPKKSSKKSKNVINDNDNTVTVQKGNILESISVLPSDPAAFNNDSVVTKLPDNEEVHEITMDFPLNLPGENMDVFDVNEVDKSSIKPASNNKAPKNIVPVVLPDSESQKIANPTNLNENINSTALFPEKYDAYDDVSMPEDNALHEPPAKKSAKKSKVTRNAMGGEVSGAVIDTVKDLSSNKESGNNNIDNNTINSNIGSTLTNSEKEALLNMENKTAKEEKNMSAKEVGNSDSEYKFPPLELLKPGKSSNNMRDDTVRENAVKLQEVLKSFGVNVTMTNYSCGPSVTRYEMVPEQGVKVSKITGLADDIMMNLAAQSIRIEAPIPGKSAVGIEIPNGKRSGVGFRELIDTEKFIKHPSKIAVAVGKDIEGNVVVEDIAKMPHLLIAGATGSGKSVCTNTLIMSILYKARPDEVKLILVDPKQVELKVYNGIPHLLTPVVTDPKKAAGALNWAVAEMTDRYQKFSECNVRNIQGYNEKVEELKRSGDIEEVTIEKMPQIVIIVDELADLMMVAKAEVEEAIVRLAQLARAAGIHLVIATQRPSVDVVTGLIKANVPSRIALSVSSGIDSRTIIDTVGAEKLLGNGDMLFYPTMYPKPLRVQGAYISDDEVLNVVEFLKANNGETTYSEEMTNKITSSGAGGAAGASGDSSPGSDRDEYFVQAGKFIIEKNKASIGMLQRMFKIGFNRAARIMDQLSEAGVVGPEVGTKPREVLMSEAEFDEYVDEYF